MEEKIQEVPLQETSSGEQNNTKYQDKAPSKTYETPSHLYSSQNQSLWPRPAKKKTEERVLWPLGNMDTWTMLFSRLHQQDCHHAQKCYNYSPQTLEESSIRSQI